MIEISFLSLIASNKLFTDFSWNHSNFSICSFFSSNLKIEYKSEIIHNFKNNSTWAFQNQSIFKPCFQTA